MTPNTYKHPPKLSAQFEQRTMNKSSDYNEVKPLRHVSTAIQIRLIELLIVTKADNGILVKLMENPLKSRDEP